MIKNKRKLAISIILFPLIDYFYLSSSSSFFNSMMIQIQGSKIELDYLSTFLCYVFLIAALSYFIFEKDGVVLDGFMLGFFIYGVYETTNKAIIKNWQWEAVALDTLWGGILYGLTTYFTNELDKIILNKFY